ncbi:MAG: uroporphyrinogen-III synthase [Bacteroidales bacterium]|jgi:uroporphyrinogen-III synthase|nr:uroporphyrinogen-III synthase [Bacteroidales bacterium]MCI1784699.1 uroporphyrinogen-III synthase [Bacteroidales bacterium]
MAIKNILISQKSPLNPAPYTALTEKYGVNISFHQFFLIEPLTSREFRAQRINPSDFSAIVFSSRHAIDAFFRLCEELRVKIPETMKYFCTTEAVAMYLQKHIVYRKRKIFFGKGTPESVMDAIGTKHKDEKFLITMSSETANSERITKLFDKNGLDYASGVFIKPVSQDIKSLSLESYDMVVFYNPNDVKSLFENFPDFSQGRIKFISYGKSIVKAMKEAGLETEIEAPTPECPSVASALKLYLETHK